MGLASVLVLALVIGISAALGGAMSFRQRQSVVAVTPGTAVGQPTIFPSPPAHPGGKGQTVSGMTCTPTAVKGTPLVHLAILVTAYQAAVPFGIGIVGSSGLTNGMVSKASCLYPLFTKDETGFIYERSGDSTTYTLGDFFALWGQDIGPHSLAGIPGTVSASIDGTPWTQSLAAIPLTSGTNITLAVGTRLPKPTLRYVLSSGS